MEFEASENLVIDDPFNETNSTTSQIIPELNQFDLIKKVNIFINYSCQNFIHVKFYF